MAPAQKSSSQEKLNVAGRTRVDEQPQNWKQELSERVETFRKRRARLQPDTDPAGNLELDFGGPGQPQDNSSLDDALVTEDRDSGFDLEIGEFAAATGKERPSPENLSLDRPVDPMMEIDAASVGGEEMALGEPLEKSPPMEILVDSPLEATLEEDDREEEIFLAPIGRRFLAGLTDTLVLILGAAVFGMIFWRFCGRLSMGPLNIAVLGFVAVILIFAYFGLFTAIASATPGLLWMGCEIRNLRGGHPTVSESFWRAFGVLVSLSALMLGFVWACVDSDSLTWHDRMSGTVITEVNDTDDPAGLQAET
jgi:uncharacterized RDD family membrane protein YckC